MKTETLNRIKSQQKESGKHEITHSSVGFKNASRLTGTGSAEAAPDLLKELKEAISSGDDSMWRMWR